MPDSIPVDVFRSHILRLLDEAVEHVPQISGFLDDGTSLFETLATISAEEASIPVSATCASLSAQVEHVRFYIDVNIRALKNEEIGRLDWGEIWRTVREVTPEQWKDSQERLMASYKRLLETINGLPFENADQVGGSINVIAHTAYHLGEIRQALCVLHQTQKSGVQFMYGESEG